MVLTLDGNSEIGAQVCSGIGNFICLWQMFQSRGIENFNLFSKKEEKKFSFTCAKQVLSYHLIQVHHDIDRVWF